jgi:hypothetical protein
MLNPFDTTGIGSLPFRDPEEAVDFSINCCDIPFWPQLPARSFLEQMIPQYAEGLPGLTLDIQRERVFIEKLTQSRLNQFYERYSEEGDFPISREFAEGLYRFMAVLKDRKSGIVKGQITGPMTFTLGLKFSDGRVIYSEEELREVALMLLKKKASWQIKMLKEVAEEVIIFIDEPVLTALGSSSYISVGEEEVVRMLKEVADTIKTEGAIAGVHCCGRANWSLVVSTGVDIINFDSYYYFDSIKAYSDSIMDFLSSDGYLAWGIVPTTEAILNEDAETILSKLKTQIKELSKDIPEELIIQRSLLTPSCGAASRSPEETEKVFRVLRTVSQAMKR